VDTLPPLDSAPPTPACGDQRASWRARHDVGVARALEGRWHEALEAFSDALTEAPSVALAPEVHALLHGNRAQAQFHCGEVPEAVESAQRALAARLVCGDAEDAPVARMRSDLGVYLAASGAVSAAQRSLHEAHTSLVARFGEHDLRLAPVLENQVRVYLLACRPEAAEPVLLRLRALLGDRGIDTDRLMPLFAAVQRTRTEVPATTAEAAAQDGSPVSAVASGQRASHDGYDMFPMAGPRRHARVEIGDLACAGPPYPGHRDLLGYDALTAASEAA
jgi:tetratricopeptide (TPR) repeat protein